MDIVLLMLIIGVGTILNLKGTNTLKGELKSLEGQMEHLQHVACNNEKKMDKLIDYVAINGEDLTFYSERIRKELGEKAQFQEKAVGELSKSITLLGYEVNGLSELVETKAEEIEKTVKTEAGRIIFTPLKIKYEERGM